jgi:hypothetical protein
MFTPFLPFPAFLRAHLKYSQAGAESYQKEPHFFMRL